MMFKLKKIKTMYKVISYKFHREVKDYWIDRRLILNKIWMMKIKLKTNKIYPVKLCKLRRIKL